MAKIIRVRAVDANERSCLGCLGCNEAPEWQYCADDSDNIRRDYIFIEDTPEARAAYAALILEHGIQPDRRLA